MWIKSNITIKLPDLQEQRLKFSLETEINGFFYLFLDLKICNSNKTEFGIFRKDKYTDNYIKKKQIQLNIA